MGYKLKRILIYPDGVTEKQVYPALLIPSSGLLGYRPLQSDLKDYSNNGNNGSWFSGTGSFEIASGKTGARVTQNTSNTNVSTQHITTPLQYNGDGISFGGWINYYSYSGGAGERPGLMNASISGNARYYCGVRPGDGNKFYTGKNNILIGTGVPSTNTWYFYVTTIEGTTMKLYVNGSLVNSATVSNTSRSDDLSWRLGCGQYGSRGYGGTSGLVRHCFVYNRGISADEVSAIYTATA